MQGVTDFDTQPIRVQALEEKQGPRFPLKYLVTHAYTRNAEDMIRGVLRRHEVQVFVSPGLTGDFKMSPPNIFKGPTATIFLFPEGSYAEEKSVHTSFINLPDGYTLIWIATRTENTLFFPRDDIPEDFRHSIRTYPV